MTSLGFLVDRRPKDLTSFFRLQSKLFNCSLYLSNPSGCNFKVAAGFPVSQIWFGHLELWWCSLLPFTPDCCNLIFLLCALDSTAGFPPSVPGHGALGLCASVWIPAHIVILGLRVVKLAETDAAARRFPWLRHSSPDEGWVQAKPAALSCGPDFLSLCLCYLPFFAGIQPATFASYPSVFFCAPAGNTMMIVVESMSNGALDSFLRVRFSGCNVHPSTSRCCL